MRLASPATLLITLRPQTMELALDGIAAYKNWAEYTQLKDPQASFTHTGALWMLGKTKEEVRMRRAKRAKKRVG